MMKYKYLTFPIVIIKNGINDIKKCLDEVISYCLYDFAQKEDGDISQRIDNVANYLGLECSNKYLKYEKGEILHDSIDIRCPKTSISIEMFFDFYKYEKTEFEIVTFLAFAALKSIIQKQGYTKITNQYLIGRMAGNAKVNEPLPEKLLKYNNRYHLDKIKTELQLNWGLKLYSFHTRGFYVSFTIDLRQLIKYAELRRNQTKEKHLQKLKKEARVAVLRQINGTTY